MYSWPMGKHRWGRLVRRVETNQQKMGAQLQESYTNSHADLIEALETS